MIAVFILVLVFFVSDALSVTRYASSSGSGSTCSNSVPCSLNTMVGQLVPGDTGIIKTGTITGSGTILLLDATASTGNVVDGTSSNRITLTSETPNTALLLGNGTQGEVLRMVNLSYWTLDSLRIENVDNAAYTGSEATVVYCSSCDNIIFRKNIVRRPNSYGNNGGIVFRGNNNLIEDNDMLIFHRNGIQMYQSTAQNNIVRRNYVGQTVPDLSAGGDGPNDFFVAYDAPNNKWENNIAEFSGTGLNGIGFAAWGAGNKYYGNISIGNVNGVTLVSAASITTGAKDYIVHNQVSIGMSNIGIFLRSPINANVLGFTAHTSTVPDRGLTLNDGDSVATASATIRNMMVINTTGAVATSIDSLTISHSQEWGTSSAWGSGTSGRTDSPPATPGDVDPNFGQCRVLVPDGTPFKGVGYGGADIGANVLYAYEDGILTNNRLWNYNLAGANRGKLLHGPAVISGVNDSGTVRSTVHQRIGFGSGTCAFPSNYGVSSRRRIISQ